MPNEHISLCTAVNLVDKISGRNDAEAAEDYPLEGATCHPDCAIKGLTRGWHQSAIDEVSSKIRCDSSWARISAS